MELFKLFGTIAINNQEANEGIDETTGKAKDSQSKIVESFKKIGTAVVTFFAVDKIVDFGGACINAASDAQAMESQFTQVFGELEAQAAQNLSNIADSAGITENRMKGSYTKIAAFAKTTGMETADALSIADRAMVAVADSAAFYDRTLEETTESLQSFLKGNFENDAALGLSCTETTRNAAANKLYGKSFKDLSESQKQLTLLQMVEDANALSGALGQSARESETWTNQVGNLQQAWTDFKAAIGGYFLEDAVSGVSKAAEAVRWLQDVITDVIEMWNEIALPAISNVANAFELVLHALDPIRQAFMNLLPESVTAASGMDIIRQAFYFLEEILTIVTGKLYEVAYWIVDHTPQIVEIITGLWDAIQYVWDTVGQPLFDILLGLLGSVRDTFAKYMPEIQKFVSTCFLDIQKFWNTNLKPCLEAIGNFIRNVLAPAFQAVFSGIIEPLIETVFVHIKNMWEHTLKPVMTGITDFLTGIFTANWRKAFEGIVSIVKGAVNGVINGVESMINGVIRAINKLIEGINKMSAIARALMGIPELPLLDYVRLPRLEKGGILEKGQVGLLEGNGAEAVVPLDQNKAWISSVAEDMESSLGGKQARELKESFDEFVQNLPEMLVDAFASMRFDVNNREFARMVKAVG